MTIDINIGPSRSTILNHTNVAIPVERIPKINIKEIVLKSSENKSGNGSKRIAINKPIKDALNSEPIALSVGGI